jgi:hypothetical protein
MSAYHTVRDLAREQIAAANHGDIERVVRLIDDRAAVLATAVRPSEADRDAIEEVLRLDRDIAGALRLRMLHIRQEVLNLQRGFKALEGYAPGADRRSSVDSRC